MEVNSNPIPGYHTAADYWMFPGGCEPGFKQHFEVAANIKRQYQKWIADHGNSSWSVPTVHFGLVMLESKVKVMLALDQELRRKESMLALVRMFLSKLKQSRGYSIFDKGVGQRSG